MATTPRTKDLSAPGHWVISLLVVVAVLATMDVTIWRSGWFVRHFPAVDPQVAPRHGHRLAMVDALHPQVVFVGNSRTLQGLRPVLFDQITGGRRETANLAISGAPLYVWHLFVRRLAGLPVARRPRAMVVGVTATDLLATEIHPEPPDLYGLLDWPGDAMPADVGSANCLDWGLGTVWRLWQNRTICHKIIEDKIRAVSGPAWPEVAGSEAPDSRQIEPIWLDEAAHGFQPQFGRSGIALVPSRPWPVGRPLPQSTWLQRLVGTGHGAGMAVHLVVLPQYGRSVPDEAHQALMADVSRMRLDGWRDYAAMPFRTTDWRDNEHLAPAGATALTRRVAADLKSWVRHAVP